MLERREYNQEALSQGGPLLFFCSEVGPYPVMGRAPLLVSLREKVALYTGLWFGV